MRNIYIRRRKKEARARPPLEGDPDLDHRGGGAEEGEGRRTSGRRASRPLTPARNAHRSRLPRARAHARARSKLGSVHS